MARVKAHIRRVALIRQSAGNQEDRLDFGRLVIHKESAQATKDGERLELTQREFRAAHQSGLPRRPGILPAGADGAGVEL